MAALFRGESMEVIEKRRPGRPPKVRPLETGEHPHTPPTMPDNGPVSVKVLRKAYDDLGTPHEPGMHRVSRAVAERWAANGKAEIHG